MLHMVCLRCPGNEEIVKQIDQIKKARGETFGSLLICRHILLSFENKYKRIFIGSHWFIRISTQLKFS